MQEGNSKKKVTAEGDVEDVLKENQQLKAEVQKLNNVIDDDIADINKRLDKMKSDMENNNKTVSVALKDHDMSIDDVKMTNNLQVLGH